MIGGKRVLTSSSDLQQSVNLQRFQDDLELLKISCDSASRGNRAASERFESVEKKIETLGTESNLKFDSLEKRMLIMTEILTRIEDTAVLNQRSGKEIASSSQAPLDQVPVLSSEPEQSPRQLGYRGIQHILANRDKLLRKIDMHVFSGPLPFDWISRVERFFRFGNYNEDEKLNLVSLSLEGPVLQ